MTDEGSSDDFRRKLPGSRSSLQKAIRRALVNRSSGIASLRKNVPSQIVRWRLEGVPEAEILPKLLAIASEVAHATGNDRINLVTGEPRWSYVAEEITRLVEAAQAEQRM